MKDPSRFALLAVLAFLLVALPAAAAEPERDRRVALERVETEFLALLQAEEAAAQKTPKLYVYRSPVRKENDVQRFYVIWHEIESHRLTLERVSQSQGIYRGRVWVVGRAFRKVGLTPQAALEAPPVEIGADRTVLILDWEKSGWRRIGRAEWEYRLDEAKPSAEER